MIVISSQLYLSAKGINKNINRHEISVSYGVFPASEWVGTFTKAISYSILSMGTIHEENNSNFGAINLDYNYRINKIVGVGIGTTYAYTKSDIVFKIKGLNIESHTTENNNYLSVMPKVKLNWINKPVFRLYSLFGLRLNIDFFSTQTMDENNQLYREKGTMYMFAYQFSQIGMEIGKNVSFFMEAGIGTSGTFIAGIRGWF
ncbi:MAG: hypothetical protein RR293_05600 [Bacteroidales bacterium]